MESIEWIALDRVVELLADNIGANVSDSLSILAFNVLKYFTFSSWLLKLLAPKDS